MHKDVELKQKPAEEKSGLDGAPVAETSQDSGLEESESVVSNFNHVDNEKQSCSCVNGTAAVVEEQLVVDRVGLHVSGVVK